MQSQMVNVQLKLANYLLLLPPPPPLPSLRFFPRASFLPTTLCYNEFSPSLSLPSPKARPLRVSHILPSFLGTQAQEEEEESSHDGSAKIDDLAPDSPVYQNTLRLVECSMFAAVAGLVYLLSNSLAIENYFGCFFALPIVVSSMRWGVAAGRKTMVATAVLLLVLSGPVKALTYVLMHGLLGFTMGSLWRLQVKWSLSICVCTLVRALGAVGYVLTSSFLIQENILDHSQSTCHCYPNIQLIRVQHRSLHDYNIHHLQRCATAELQLLRVFAAHPVCSVLVQARDEGLPEIAKMAGKCIVVWLAPYFEVHEEGTDELGHGLNSFCNDIICPQI